MSLQIHNRQARERGVILTTFDTEQELQLQLQLQTRKRRKCTRPRRPFEYRLQQLQNYTLIHGTAIVDPLLDYELSLWTKTIRYNYKHQATTTSTNSTDSSKVKVKRRRPMLPQYKLDQLQALGFVWTVQGVTWAQKFDELQAYKQTHGHFNIPMDHPTLGIWVRNQKRDYRHYLAKRPTGMTEERLALLNSTGFWDTYTSHRARWERRYEELRAFHQQYGHSNVPEDYEDNYPLGQWVMNQRMWYKRFLAGLWTALTPDRIMALETLDFTWSVQASSWYAMLQRLKEYHSNHNTTVIRMNDAPNQDLRIWLIQQRHAHGHWQEGRTTWLTNERVKALEDIPDFRWEGHKPKEGVTAADWARLFEGIKEKGISANSRPKEHWFDGQNRFDENIKVEYTDQDLVDLWNQEEDDDD